MKRSSLLSGLFFATVGHAAVLQERQFQVTNNVNGIIPASELPTAVVTSLPVETPPSTAYDSSALNSLWASVELNIPVEVAVNTTVQNVTKFTVPETPLLPYHLRDNVPGNYTFPAGFKFGVASAAQQYEGAVKTDGRGPSHWDYLCHREPSACTNYTSDVTDNGYYLYKQDLARVKAMGINTFSFSISWTRIVPFGSKNAPLNEAGLQFYDDLIDECISNGLTPVPTLFHWDTPWSLVLEYGAFMNDSVVDDFTRYAKTVFQRYGDRVKTFITFNEPRVYCSQYGGAPFTPYYPSGINATIAPYPCSYHLLRAHGSAVKVYRDLVSSGNITKGEIALKNDDSYPLPRNSSSEADQEAAKRHFDFYIGLFSQPIYGDGNYPTSVRNTIPEQFLPNLTSTDKSLIKGSADFYAIDGYRTNIAQGIPGGISNCVGNLSNPSWPVCEDPSQDAQYSDLEGYAIGPNADPNAIWLYNASAYLRRQFKLLKQYFNYDKIYLSEFGFARPFEYLYQNKFDLLYDDARASYYNDYMTAVLEAIHLDNIPVAGVFAWSLVDNFEWGSGLDQRFGLQYVNYTDQQRYYKLSFLTFRDFIKNHRSD